jgi:hypothetical protein
LRRSVERAAQGERDLLPTSLDPKLRVLGPKMPTVGHKMPRELELKVKIQPSAFQRLTGARAVDGIAIGRMALGSRTRCKPGSTRELHSASTDISF